MRACQPTGMDRYLIQTVALRHLNDELRTRFRGGTVVIHDEVRELGSLVVANAILAMAENSVFHDDEHKNGHFYFLMLRFDWAISYGGSRNPCNPRATNRELHVWTECFYERDE
jgi:hypothetical protein